MGTPAPSLRRGGTHRKRLAGSQGPSYVLCAPPGVRLSFLDEAGYRRVLY